MRFIKAFDEIKKGDIATAGGKGANLGEMTQAGITVPPGVVLTANAYDYFMEEGGIVPHKFDSAAQIRSAILSTKIPSEIETEIRNFCDTLKEGARMAVRSSATAEDLDDASFAGQQETYLNVIGTNNLLAKIRECYASLWGDRAVSYRKNSGYDKQKTSLAVVIQQMVESESAGVMFTSDPAGDRENIHINAAYGLGEAVVSGIVSPDEYICTREGTVLKQITGSKEIEIIYDAENGGTKKVSVDENRRKQSVLSKEQIATLVKEGVRIEKHYGHPMDIEWAVKSGRIYILQARSITTLKENVGKTFTEKDFAGYPKVKPAKGAMREAVLFNLEKTPTPYYPLDHDFGGNVGEQKGVLFSEIGINFKGGMYPIDRDGISYQASNKFKLGKNVFSIPKYLKLIGDVDQNIKCADESLAKCRAEFEKEKSLSPKDAGAIGESLQRMRKLIGRTAYDRFLYALFPNAIESMKVTKVLRKIDDKLNSYDVLEGLSYVTADMNRAMKELCECIVADSQLKETVMNADFEKICSTYPELGSRFDLFLKQFGSKSDFNCYCFIAETWRENPDRFVNALRPMLKSGGEAVATKEESEQHFADLMTRVREALPDRKYAEFEKRVKGLRHYHYIREATQYLWESEFEYCRKLLRKLAEITKVSYEDYLFLFADELFDVCRQGSLGDKAGLIDQRKNKRAFAEAYWDKCMKDALAGDDDSIKGIGASNGQVKGKVCIVHSPEEFYKLEKGDILVCTYTDPEWTPLFALAAGVVVDTGGTLSHAAIVAREYGIPAVLATGDATLKLKDGDVVLVNATESSVSLLSQ
ncbi:MAG: phosphoenolpyruvate synthase [Lachnospiraceae bacterium]|nr:phosphoenolpyruvate synthase [Lachnospiraceae bacterium]